MAEQKATVEKGLEYLKTSDKIVGDIVNYCVAQYKAEPTPKTLALIKQYVVDTATSVSEHILTIGHNLQKMVEMEVKEVEQLSYETSYIAHRLNIHQSYMSELFMTKFQVYPRPKKTVDMLRQKIPDKELPKFARQRPAWKRTTTFDYSILDSYGVSDVRAKKQLSASEYARAKARKSGMGMRTMTSAAGSSSPRRAPASPVQRKPRLLSDPVPVSPTGFHGYSATTIIHDDSGPPPISFGGPPPIPSGPPAVPSGPPAVPGGPPPAPGGPPPAPSAAAAGGGSVPEELVPFMKMLKMGVPRPGVDNKMRQAGLEPTELDQFLGGAAVGPQPVGEPPEDIKRFIKMTKIGVPKANVIKKMIAEGYDPAELDKYS